MKRKKLAVISLIVVIVLLMAYAIAWLAGYFNKEVDVQTQIYNFLIEEGFNPIQASAILATAKQNSNMNCIAVSVPDGKCYGLFQWTHVRLENLKQFANANNKMVEDLDTQLLFMMEELNSESGFYIGEFQYRGYEWDEFWEAQTPSEAAMTFNMVYSRPTINSNRVGEWAEEIYLQYNN